MRRTILLADDSPTIRRLVIQTFSDGDFQIVEVSNGDAAIKALEEVKPSAVLADIYMPGKNGYQVCSYVRSHPNFAKTPVVLLVGAFDAFDEKTATDVGATANITKPFEPRALIDLVNSILLPDLDAEPAKEPVAVELATAEPAVAVEPAAAEPAVGFAPATAEPGVVAEPAVTEAASEPVEAEPTTFEPSVVAQQAAAAATVPDDRAEDLLGLRIIFKEEPQQKSAPGLTEQDIDRIADRVIQRISSQVIESIAWDIVPDITEKIVREELKRTR
jgi:CheY-like chemotaxis protein